MRDCSQESWRLKLDRAEHHLKELETVLIPYRERRRYGTRWEVHIEGKPDSGRFFVELPPLDPQIQLVLGDIIHNIRSSLDHLAVALTVDDERDVYTCFPIFTEDIWMRTVDGTAFVSKNDEARERFTRAVKGMDSDVKTIIKTVQPYVRKYAPAAHHTLATLSNLENLDKHRELIPFTWGLRDVALIAAAPSWAFEWQYYPPRGVPVPPIGFCEERTPIVPPNVPPADRDPEMKVYVEGTAVVTVNVGLPPPLTMDIVDTIRKVIRDIRTWLLPRLEPYAYF